MSAPGLPTPHPSFAAHFADDIYEDDADDFAPFGSQEAADLLVEWAGRADELDDSSAVSDLLPQFDDNLGGLIGADEESVDVETLVIAAGFTLMRLTGQIDDEGRSFVMRSLDHLEGFHGEQAQFSRMQDDLSSFDG